MKILIFILNLIAPLIPMQLKRLILISTFYQKAIDDKVFEHVDLNKLNHGMNIASSCSVIESAMSVKDMVWKDVDLNKLLSTASVCELNGERVEVGDARILADRVIAVIPKCLRYDKPEMRKDLTLLFCAERLSVSRT